MLLSAIQYKESKSIDAPWQENVNIRFLPLSDFLKVNEYFSTICAGKPYKICVISQISFAAQWCRLQRCILYRSWAFLHRCVNHVNTINMTENYMIPFWTQMTTYRFGLTNNKWKYSAVWFGFEEHICFLCVCGYWVFLIQVLFLRLFNENICDW